MINKIRYILIACLAAALFGGLLVANQLQPAKADIASLSASLLADPIGSGTCSKISFEGRTDSSSGYAAVRVWYNVAFGPTLMDSFVSGYPSYYTPIFQIAPGFGYWYEASPSMTLPHAVPNGTILVLRVYRSLVAGPNSWDQQSVQDTSLTCVSTPPTPHP